MNKTKSDFSGLSESGSREVAGLPVFGLNEAPDCSVATLLVFFLLSQWLLGKERSLSRILQMGTDDA